MAALVEFANVLRILEAKTAQVSIDTPNPNDSEKPLMVKIDNPTPDQIIAVMNWSEQLM